MISIRMVKICDEFVCKLWTLFFESCLESGKFPVEWKKVNVFPIHKTSGKQKIKNYRPTSLLPITGKILESLLHDRMFEFLTENNLISDNQSGFKPGDLCINQLLSITLEFINILMIILKSEQFSYEFNKVWHKGLIYKLKQNGISGNILSTIIDFLSFRKQRVVLNGQVSQWTSIEWGAPQWSILGPLLFFINIYPHMNKMGPRGPNNFIFGDYVYSKNARKLRFHVFLHFNARKHTISSFYLKWTKFKRNCDFSSSLVWVPGDPQLQQNS